MQNDNGAVRAQGTDGSWQQWTGTTAATTVGGVTTATGTAVASVNSGNTGVTATAGTSPPASGTGAGGATTGTTTTTTPKDPGTGVTVGVVSNCGAGMSPSGTTIPSAALITDCQGNVWTLAGGIPSMNQNPAGALTTASLLLLYNGNLYAEDASKIWWQWNSGTASWIQLSADPRLSANNGGGGTASGGCGSSNGRTSATAPTTNLCTTGTASVVASATGSWNWSCSGSGGGTVSQCFALKPNTSGQFSVVNGQIIAPNGQVFIARGINVSDDIFGSTTASGAPITTLFPNINFLRLAIGSYDNGPAYYQDFVSKMTALGIVVEFDDHYNGAGGAGGGQGVIFTGSQLSAESSWFSALATAFANNPYVWFGTNNEPSESEPGYGQQDPAALSDWQLATYNAIRGAGNNSIIMVEMNCGPANPGMACGVGYRTSDYAGMTNIIWDSHYYGWVVPNESSDQGLVDQTLAQEIAATQQITSADGKVPVLIGEYGPSTDGQNRDPNGMQVVMSVINSGYSSAAWHWCPHAPDDTLTDCNGNLTPFGQMVSAYISSGR